MRRAQHAQRGKNGAVWWVEFTQRQVRAGPTCHLSHTGTATLRVA